ncbi:uncharacterized protein LOC124373158 [Homalodisca vitripennis]|uniref:uncharacterized protein LOC124373158 n=1 Tax=Homalodisca vitripennis TaxID=197043 RepID=UPI001EEB433A|nr:uncharacterized protein LOC124373158 [Homalodisca vitripennis]
MASGGVDSFSILCRDCNKVVEVYNGDVQSSMELHRKKMHSSPNKPRHDSRPVSRGREKYENIDKRDYETFSCPICKNNVKILKSNFKRGIQEHFETHNQVEVKPQSDDQLYTFSGIKNWIENSNMSEKSAETNSNQRKNNQRRHNVERNTLILPPDIRSQRGYVVERGDNFFCNICSITFDPTNVAEHLKTKTHEDNVILFLKEKLPMHLQNSMEFISFYNSNLSCNLCRCKVFLNSFNPYETIFHIISHNSDKSHSSKRSKNEPNAPDDDASSLLKSLAEKYPLVNSSKHLIETCMEPQFKCKLCDKNIMYSDKENILAKNFTTHLNSSTHKKSEKAESVLKSFESLNINGQRNHKFIVANGAITCVACKIKTEADISKLIDHIQEVNQSKQSNHGPSFTGHSNQSVKSHQSDKSSDSRANQKGSFVRNFNKDHNTQSNANTANSRVKKPNIGHLLKTLQQEFGNIETIIQHSNGRITCIVCNCPIRPTENNIKMHLLEASHKENEQTKMRQSAKAALDLLGGNNPQNTVEQLFQSLPQIFQQDKPFIKDSPIDGYIVCSLCECVINPHYFSNHLVDENHLREKKKLFGSS